MVIETRDAGPHERAGVLTASLLIGAASMLILGIAPILFGGLAEAGRLSLAGVGQAATLETLGLAVGATFGPSVMNAGRMRAKTATAALLLMIVNLVMLRLRGATLILADRALSGLCEGFLLAAVIVVLTHSRRPDRMNGLLLGVSSVPQVVAAYLLPTAIIPRFGLDAGFLILVGGAVVAAAAAPALVERVRLSEDHLGGRLQLSPAACAFALGAFLQSVAIGGAWNYAERLAAQHHLGAQTVGAALASSLFFQVGGALASAWLSSRLPARRVLVAGSCVQALVLVGMVVLAAPLAYIALSCAFGLFWLALSPFQVREVIALDPSRRLAILMAPLGLVGMSVGPLAASFIVTDDDVSIGFWAAATLLAAAAALYVLAGGLPSRPDRRGRSAATEEAARAR